MPTTAEILLVVAPILGLCTWVHILFGDPDYEEYLNDFFQEWIENFYPVITGLFLLVVGVPWFGIVALVHWLSPDMFAQYAHAVGPLLSKFPTLTGPEGWSAYAGFPPFLMFSIWLSTTIPVLIPKYLQQYRNHRQTSVI